MSSSQAVDSRALSILEDRKGKGRYRSIKQRPRRSSSHEGSEGMVDFSSNDYLSLTQSAQLRERFLDAASRCPAPLFGSTGSRLLDGTTPYHLALESRLAAFFRSPSALLFNSGWDANVSFFASVPQPGDLVLFDELIHASVWDGMRASRLPRERRIAFKHNDPSDLERVISSAIADPSWTAGPSARLRPVLFIAVESLYSMDGDLCALPQILDTLQSIVARHPDRLSRQQICIVVDEAHTTGVLGERGRGLVQDLGAEVASWVDVRLMTFGKGVGGQGAVLLSSQPIRDFLINYARPFIFSTAMSVMNVLAVECAMDVLQSSEGDERRTRLARLCTHLQTTLSALCTRSHDSISLLPSSPSPYATRRATPIQPLLTSDPHGLSAHLQALGYLVRPVVYPTVPKGLERVRICLHAENEVEDLDGLVEGIRRWVETRGKGGDAVPVRARL